MAWRMVYRHDDAGRPIIGHKSELIEAIREGAAIRFEFERRTREGRAVREIFDAAHIKMVHRHDDDWDIVAQCLVGGAVEVMSSGTYTLTADIVTHAVSTNGDMRYLSVYRPLEGAERVSVSWHVQR